MWEVLFHLAGRDVLMGSVNAFTNNQFSYSSIIWMFYRKMDCLKMEKIQFKALTIACNSNESLEDLFCTAMKYLFIKNSYVN